MGKGGERSDGAEERCDVLASDPNFSDFLAEDFTATEFASNALAESNATAQVWPVRLCGHISDCNL